MSQILVHIRDLGVPDSSGRLRVATRNTPSASSSARQQQQQPPSPRDNASSFVHFDKRHVEEDKSSAWVKANEARRNEADRVEHLHKLKDEAERRRRIGAVVPGPTTRRFRYAPLDDPRTQIRLLQLDIISGQAICIQQAFSLDTAPPYVAVSYTWGSPADQSIVWINKAMLIVPASCASALQELASQGVKHWVWIDAICINQVDTHEKAHQVHMMTQIYSRAVWVAAIPSDPLLVRTLTYGLASVNEPLQWLSADPFWSRIWIVQEFLVAKEVRLLGGGSCLQDQELRHMLCSAGTASDISSTRMSRLVRDRYDMRGVAPPTSLVFRCLSKYSDLDCTDPRDRIFALVPMALRDSGVSLLQPNYEQTTFETLLTFAKYMCNLASKRDAQGSSTSDLLLCLMKVTQELQLDLQSDEIRSFLTGQTHISAQTKEEEGELEEDEAQIQETNLWTSRQIKAVCLTALNSPLRSVSDLSPKDWMQLKSTGLDVNSHGIRVICDAESPAYAVSANVLPSDVLISPTIGSMMTTWNLVFRKSNANEHHYDLIGQAVLLPGGHRFASRGCCCCPVDTCPTHKQWQVLKLHTHDAVALALQARTPVERLLDAVSIPRRGTFAIFS